MQINKLPTSDTFASDDIIVIEINKVTYKLTGATLASALKAVGNYLVTGDVANNLTTTAAGKVLDARQGKALNDQINATQSGLAIIVDGDRASMAVPVGGYAYIKNNTHGLAEGLYTNTYSAAFPASGGTADGTVFTAVSGGGLNAIQQSSVGGLTDVIAIPPNTNFTSDVIPFGRTFARTPAIVANVVGYFFADEISHINIVHPTTTGFQFRVKNLCSDTLNIQVSWMAYNYM